MEFDNPDPETSIKPQSGSNPVSSKCAESCRTRVVKSGSCPPLLCTCNPTWVANLAFFPRIWACFFVDLRGFLKTCGLLVLIKICLVFGLVFCRFLYCGLLFYKFYGYFSFSTCYCKTKFGLIYMCKFANFWLVFSDLYPCFCI